MPRVCRICLSLVEKSTPVILLNAVILNNSYTSYQDKLTACVPEIALDAVNEPIMCQNCTASLQTAFEFRSQCLQTEVIIQAYIQEKAGPAIISFSDDFVQYLSTYQQDAELDSDGTATGNFKVEFDEGSDVVIVGTGTSEETMVLEDTDADNLAGLVEVVEEVRFNCSSCSAGFGTKGELNKHHGRMHRKREITKCAFCERSFKSLKYLHRHLQTHREYTCGVCLEEFDDKLKFDKHQKDHVKHDGTNPSTRRVKTEIAVVRRRGNLPKHATKYMRKWLLEHYEHPYPSDGEKQEISEVTQLTIIQVENWFINARRRVLQPLLTKAQFKLSENGVDKIIDDSDTSEQD